MVFKICLVFSVIVKIFLIKNVFSANVLVLSPILSHSHSIWHRVLVQELANHKHNVTFVSPDYEKQPKNYTHIHFDGAYDKLELDSWDMDQFQDTSPFDTLLSALFPTCCQYVLETNGTKQLLEYPKQSFDLIIMDISMATECFYPLLKKLGPTPIVGTSPIGLLPWYNVHTGDWLYPSTYPFYSVQYDNKMSFWQRFVNFYVYLFQIWYRTYVVTPEVLKTIKSFYGPSGDYSMDLDKQISLFLMNVDPVLGFPVPVNPNVIPVGGLHIKLKGNMPPVVQKFLDEAKEGAIFFSLGSNIRSDLLDKSRQAEILKAFSKLPYKILWKFESDNLPDKPPNVMIYKWLPQPDVLNHPNVKLFMTHNGGLSSQEAIHFGKPTIGIPVFLDQQFNAKRLEKKEIGVSLNLFTLNADDILNAVREVIGNPKYTGNVERLSAAFRDQPQTPLERAVFWIEYVIRHKGAKELEPSSLHMSFYQTYCLDTILTTLLIIITIGYVIKIILSQIVALIRKNPSKKKQKKA